MIKKLDLTDTELLKEAREFFDSLEKRCNCRITITNAYMDYGTNCVHTAISINKNDKNTDISFSLSLSDLIDIKEESMQEMVNLVQFI